MGECLSPNGWNHAIKKRRTGFKHALPILRVAILATGNLSAKVFLKAVSISEQAIAIYFGIIGNTIVLLLCGGDKSSQTRDIERAKTYWQNYKEIQQ